VVPINGPPVGDTEEDAGKEEGTGRIPKGIDGGMIFFWYC